MKSSFLTVCFLTSILILVNQISVQAQIENTKKDITIFMVGNSTMADKPYKDGNPEKGWGQIFPLYFKEGIKVENHAMNGRSTKSFIDEGRWILSLIKSNPAIM